jgi:hypothetical protein
MNQVNLKLQLVPKYCHFCGRELVLGDVASYDTVTGRPLTYNVRCQEATDRCTQHDVTTARYKVVRVVKRVRS